MKIRLIFYILTIFSIVSCTDDEIDWGEEKYNSRIILASSSHMAFPDLAQYKGVWYLAYRESDKHVLGKYSRIKVLKSSDFENWVEINNLEIDGFDCRDPKFSYDSLHDEFYLHIHVASEKEIGLDNYAAIRKNLYFSFDKDKNKFNIDLSNLNYIRLKNEFRNDWLWRPIWYNGECYVGGYDRNSIRFYKYSSLDSYPVVFSSHSLGGESTLYFYDNNLYILLRTKSETEAYFGKLSVSNEYLSKINSDENISINWEELNYGNFGGPNMVIKEDIAYLMGRVNRDKVELYSYVLNKKENNMKFQQRFISYGGDCAYPGLFLKDNSIYGVYYTQNASLDRFEIRSFIYSLNYIDL